MFILLYKEPKTKKVFRLKAVILLIGVLFVTHLPSTHLFAATNTPPSVEVPPSQQSVPPSITSPQHPLWRWFNIIGEASGLPEASLSTLVNGFIRLALSFVGLLLFINILYAGFLWMLSGGDAEKTARAKQILLSSVIGLVIIIFSYSFVVFIIRTLLGAPPDTSSI